MVLDHLSLDLTTAAPGTYTLLVEVTDLSTQATARGTSNITLVQ